MNKAGPITARLHNLSHTPRPQWAFKENFQFIPAMYCCSMHNQGVASMVATDGRSHVVWMTQAATLRSWKVSLVLRDIVRADDLHFVPCVGQFVGLQSVP